MRSLKTKFGTLNSNRAVKNGLNGLLSKKDKENLFINENENLC